MVDLEPLKQSIVDAVDGMRDEWIGISRTLHANPEVAFQEFKSAALLSDTLEKHGLHVERGVGGLQTAFRAEAKGNDTGPTVAILAEYDALEGLGHACGHNIIGTAAIAAGIAVKTVMDRVPGRVLVIGTPAEEGGGGKIKLLERGVFRDVDAAMMVHPSGYTMTNRGSLASNRLGIEFTGKAAHAAGAPEDGINALEAVILTFNNINGLRLHLRPDARIHGIITHGGTAVNIIPEYAAAQFSIRARTQQYADQLLERVIQCAQAGATSTGALLKYAIIPGYQDMVPNAVMAELFARNWRAIGVEVHDPRPNERMGSTDMGNISHALPAIHPYIAIAPDGTPGHSIEFRAAGISPEGDAGLLQAAKGMAMTAIDLLCQPELMRQVKQEFIDQIEK